MRIIYEPRGRAREYADLAINLYRGCSHGCRYCYVPAIFRTDIDRYSADVSPRKMIVDQIRKDAETLAPCDTEILLCFTCDPYQHAEEQLGITREVINVLMEHGLRFTILTKSPTRASRDFDLLAQYDRCALGVTLSHTDRATASEWEPHADSPADRMKHLRTAHDLGITTWVSIEPVLNPNGPREVIEVTHEYVDHYKIGKLNHHRDIEATIDWKDMTEECVNLLTEYGYTEREKINASKDKKKGYYLKDDLKRAIKP